MTTCLDRPAVTCVASSTTPWAYLRFALVSPIATLPAVGGLGLAFCVGSVWMALITLAIVGLVAGLLVRSDSYRRSVDRCQRQRERYHRRAAYLPPLEAAGGNPAELQDLVRVVEDIERADPAMAHRMELDDLLDRWVQVAIARGRGLRALRSVNRDELALSAQAAAASGAAPGALPAQVLERRISLWDECQARVARLAAEQAAMSELIRLIGQRTASPPEPDGDELVQRLLSELDEHDEAVAQLAARQGAS